MNQQAQKQQQWIIVKKPKRKQIKKQQKLEDKRRTKIVWEGGKPLYIADNHEADLEQFINSGSFKINWEIIASKIQARSKVIKQDQIYIQVECLGLGDFIKYAKPHYQYLFLIKLLIPLCKRYTQNKLIINTYDPVFSQQCIQQVQKIGTFKADNIPQQSANKIIILYMPHCERFLYQRYCNRYDKNQVLVIGNSIKQYINRCQLISQNVPQCFINRNVQQSKLKDYKESFNDTFCYYI